LTNWLNGYCLASVQLPTQVSEFEAEDTTVCAQSTHTQSVSSLYLHIHHHFRTHYVEGQQRTKKKKERTGQGFSPKPEHTTRRSMSTDCSSTSALF